MISEPADIEPIDVETIDVDAIRSTDATVPSVQELDSRCFCEGERTDIASQCKQPFAHVWVAQRKAASTKASVVGFMIAWHIADELHILSVATDPEVRRRGIGNKLMNHAISFAKEHSVRLVLLEVRKNNAPALGLYKSFGFSTTRVRTGYYSDGEDGVEMALSINQIAETR